MEGYRCSKCKVVYPHRKHVHIKKGQYVCCQCEGHEPFECTHTQDYKKLSDF